MAQIIVRPAVNVTATNVGYTSGTSAVAMISETTADGDTTTVTYAKQNATITVRCGTPSVLSKIKTINSVTVYATCRGNGYNETINFGFNAPSTNSTTFSTGTSKAYASYSHTFVINNTPATFNLENLCIFFTMTTFSSSKTTVYLTQMYVVIDYVEKTITSYVKIDGTWHLVSKIYVKINGVWKEVNAIYDKISGTWHTG